MKTKRILAIDLGNSGGKCFVGKFEKDSFTMDEIHRFANEGVSFFLPESNGKISERVYWDDILLYRNIIKGIRNYRRECSDFLDSIGIDTWGPDGQFITQNSEMIGKVYCYRDHRLDSMIETLKLRIEASRLYEITGIHFYPFNISNQLLWFMLNRKSLLKPGCTFLPMPTIFYFYLGNVKKIDTTWASVTQLMDARTKKWSNEVLERLDIPKEIMPEIVAPGTVVGRISEPLANSLELNRAKLIAVGSHDTASAYAAAPVENAEEALVISSGTWSLIGKLLPEPITTQDAMAANLSNEGGIGNIRFLKNCMGLWLVQELLRVWHNSSGYKMDWNEVVRLLEKASPFTSFIDPDYQGFYNPYNMEREIAEYCKRKGQYVPKDYGTYLRIVYESLAMKYRKINEEISRICGTHSKVIHIVGGGCKNQLLNQFTANATGLPVVAGPEEATAAGNILAQAMGLGIFKNLNTLNPMIKNAFNIKKYVPRNISRWEEAYKRFTQITLL